MALTKVSTDGVKDGSLLNADINASAAIARTKLANVDLVDDTSPQLGGDLDTNSFEILLDDNHAVKFGNDTDLTVLHSGSTGVINNVTGDLFIKTTGSGDDIVLTSNDDIELQPQAGEDGIKVIGNGAVELYYDNSKRLQTEAWGTRIFATGQDALLVVQGEEDRSATLRLQADDGDDYPDYSQFHKNKDTGKLHIQNLTGSDVWEDNIVCVNNGAVELYYDNSKKLETLSNGARVQGGLLFGSDTAAANALDDYEEGTWTPTYHNYDSNISYSANRNGEYVKIGSLVHVRAWIQGTATGSLSGYLEIGGLPFAGAQGGYGRTPISIQAANWSLSSDNFGMVGLIDESYNRLQVWKGSTDGYDQVSASNFNDNGFIYLAGTYQLAIG
jgi:hypothetical protein